MDFVMGFFESWCFTAPFDLLHGNNLDSIGHMEPQPILQSLFREAVIKLHVKALFKTLCAHGERPDKGEFRNRMESFGISH